MRRGPFAVVFSSEAGCIGLWCRFVQYIVSDGTEELAPAA